MPNRPDYEEIERVFDTAPKQLLGRLPESTEARRAAEHARLAYNYAREARERARDLSSES